MITSEARLRPVQAIDHMNRANVSPFSFPRLAMSRILDRGEGRTVRRATES